MGYTTDFDGNFKINKKLDRDTLALLIGLNETRRMARNIDGFGVQGEFYIDSKDTGYGDHSDNVIDHNSPPRTQPGLWCQWRPNDAGTSIAWDGGEKFYHYIEWLQYLIDAVLAPRGYSLSGTVTWQGEQSDDTGKIIVKDNSVTGKRGRIVYD